MDKIFTNNKKCTYFDKPTHIAQGKINGNFKLNCFDHTTFMDNHIKSKKYNTVQYYPTSNTWCYYNI